MFNHRNHARVAVVALALAAGAAAALLPTAAASAHGFSSTVYVDVTAPADGQVRTDLDLEYDLLVVSAAENENDPDLFTQGTDLFETGSEAVALTDHADSVLAYITERLTVTAAGEPCAPSPAGGFDVHDRDGVPYARVALDYACPAIAGDGHEVRSALFPDAEGYVADTKTIVTYDLDDRSGSAALDAEHPSFSTEQGAAERFGEFFLLGAEHLLTGLDHILFLLALIVGSRRLRDVVLAATTFTVAHSVTFLLAALGVVSVPSAVVEPVIALSIAVVAAWYLWGTWRRRPYVFTTFPAVRSGPLGMDRADWTRLAVVFCFGLVHGLGFAGALGIDEPWSWTLLWSLLVFNVGIEAVQLGIIALVFPALVVLRRKAPRAGLWVGLAIAAVVTVVGLIWFVQRLLGIG
ncbi:HupE/UreJ family protein [Herbiconiux daphne]|uniref:HupE/UreJ family protein n=1 Tax=Herbiconiux daphne TaxID=2970914 RepID=A0ABT2H8G1_9MICO|nr:HupE/UreJ family protein [Herbiconiux daphne]MCS5736245.1 HupE/UreJ family protein [Herbiconiux daphne]